MKTQFIAAFFLCVAALYGQAAWAQAGAYTDPAQAYVRMLLDKSENAYVVIGNFKVKGTPYLFGERYNGKVYAKEGTVDNVFVSYNTYNQTLEVFTTKEQEAGIEKSVESIDSFRYSPPNYENLFFVNGAYLGAKEKAFFQRVAGGSTVQLYKRYKSDLGIVSTNYIQSELRQFNLAYDYFYYDLAKKQLKKLRTDAYSVKKELGPYGAFDAAVDGDALTINPETALKTIFAAINKE